MIVIPSKKILIFTPPKCCSTSLHSALCPNYGYYVLGPQGHSGEIDKHTTCVPYDYLSYTRFCVTRPSVARYNSLYYHFTREQGRLPESAYRKALESNMLSWFYTWTLSRYACNVHIDYLIHFNYLETFLRETVDNRINLPHENGYKYEPVDAPDYWIALDTIKGVEYVGS